jgi:cytochrome c551/c552
MPASEQTYRPARTLHIVFAVTSVAMTATIVWMILADHLRPWKQVQREFQQIETAKLSAQREREQRELQEAKRAQLAENERLTEAATRRARENDRAIRALDGEIRRAKGQFQKLDTERKFKKAELDSQRSLYDGMIERDERVAARNYLTGTIAPTERQLNELSHAFERAERTLYELQLRRDLLASVTVAVSDPPAPGSLAQVAGFHAGDVMEVADFEALRTAVTETLRGAAPAQTVHVAVTREGAGNVPVRFEVRPIPEPSRPEDADAAWVAFGLKAAPQTAEVLAKNREDLTRDVDRIARTLKQKQEQYGEGGPINRFFAWVRGLPLLDLAAPPTKIQQISLPELTINYNFKDVPRYDRCTTCHMGIDRVGYETDAAGNPMPTVHRSHPHLTDGATAVNPRGEVVPAGLYLDANGPHPINSFGCTICHGGQGSGTTFTYASHHPNDHEQEEAWRAKYDWREMHHWDFPMLPSRFVESSCLKCHHMVTDLAEHQAPKLLAGYQRITRYGCTGCHTIGGEGAFGPDLTDNRPVGPNLRHVASKVDRDWLVKWIKNPHAFRPDSRMPRFYDLENNNKPGDQARANAEVHAIAHYLFAKSTPPAFTEPPEQSDPARGKQLFFEKGCMACHADRAYTAADLPPALYKVLDPAAPLNPAYKLDPESLHEPASFPERVRPYANAEFGPNLSSMAAKFPSREQGYTWLANWIRAPETYHAESLMPNLQLSAQDAADIAAWILATRQDWGPGSDAAFWPVAVDVPPVDSDEVREGLDQLTRLFLSKSKTYNQQTVLLSEIDSFVAGLSRDEKLLYVGERTISRMGCFGCHKIAGFEDAKPIGTALNDWGSKSPTRLDYAHIVEYLTDHTPGAHGVRDGTPEHYQAQLAEQTRGGFLFQKLHRPRSFDYRKDRDDLRSWDERLRMPQFAWADDPAAIEEVMTFVLGLTGERVAARYLAETHYNPAQIARARGERLLERYNCRGCHVLAMPTYTIAAGTSLDRVFRSDEPADPNPFAANVALSYDNRAKDFPGLYPDRPPYEPDTQPTLTPHDGSAVVLEGMPIGVEEEEDDEGRKDRTLYLQLWRPVTIRGYTFGVGDTVRINPDRVAHKPAEGGDYAWLYAVHNAEQTGELMPTFWNRLPPPLLREGHKVQTPWLTTFLQDPYKIRPQAQLRMPRFHYGATGRTLGPDIVPDAPEPTIPPVRPANVLAETRDLANYFAARDGAAFPYQEIPQREQAYLAARDSLLAGEEGASATDSPYLDAGWALITKNQCVQCHAIGQFKPTGEEKSHGPNLRQVADRMRPEYLLEWLANPTRLLPYTAMPQNFTPPGQPVSAPVLGVPHAFEDKPLETVRAVRDVLLNYLTAIEQQLASAAPPAPPEPPAGENAGAGAGAAAPGANP